MVTVPWDHRCKYRLPDLARADQRHSGLLLSDLAREYGRVSVSSLYLIRVVDNIRTLKGGFVESLRETGSNSIAVQRSSVHLSTRDLRNPT